MKVVSLNANKRLGNAAVRGRFTRWVQDLDASMLVIQEPWARRRATPVPIEGYEQLGGNDNVFSWVRSGLRRPSVIMADECIQRVELGYATMYGCYLDAYTPHARAAQLQTIRNEAVGEQDRPLLIVGDFNLAPTPEDGLSNGRPSQFNNEIDRTPFRELLESADLVDMTSTPGANEFTIVRKTRDATSEFRCDLALVSSYFAPQVDARYEHATRLGSLNISDHSAILLELPVTLPKSIDESEWLFPSIVEESDADREDVSCHPHKTAMSRQGHSPVAEAVVSVVRARMDVSSILDFGCGRGADVNYYRESGIQDVHGYDPHRDFGYDQLPQREFDVITMAFVLNVLPDPWSRVKAIQQAAQFLKPTGCMLIVTRSPNEIEAQAHKGKWPRHNDGYWSHERKGTFQRGISANEIGLLARRAGLVCHPWNRELSFGKSASHMLLAKVGSPMPR